MPASSRFQNYQTAGGTATGFTNYLGALARTPSPGRSFIRVSNITAVTSAGGLATVTFPARSVISVNATNINAATTLPSVAVAAVTSIGVTAGAIAVAIVSISLNSTPAIALAASNVNVEAWYY